MKKVLLITYYWPPGSGAGVYRWLRMSKYFEENGFELTVYCPENAAWPIRDESLITEIPENIKVIRQKIIEPAKFISKNPNKGAGFTSSKKLSAIQKLMIWVRGNFFVPDARILWVRPSVKYLNKYLRENPGIEYIISTGPPHSMHLIAKKLKKKQKLFWVADFRDPWTGIDFYKELHIGRMADRKNKRQEKAVLAEADEIVTISENCGLELQEISKRKINIITNGFEFTEKTEHIELSKKFTIAHFGSMAASRNPENLWKALSDVCKNTPDFKDYLSIELYGNVDHIVSESVSKYGLTDYLKIIGTLSHSESLQLQQQSQILLLVVNNSGNSLGTLTGKFFEYLNARRPIIAIGPKGGNLDEVLKLTEAGRMFDYDDAKKIQTYIEDCFRLYLDKNLFVNPKNLNEFSTKNLTRKFCDLMK